MPKVTLSPTAVTNAGIAAAGSRVLLEFSIAPGGDPCLWCYGTTFVEADAQVLLPNVPRIFVDTYSQGAFSFGLASLNTVINVSSI